MHNASTVVTIREMPSKRALREYDHSKNDNRSQVTVRLPFDTEYAIALKTQDYVRRRMEVRIDGALAADVIMPVGYGAEAVLERFMDSPRRFKFVRASNEAVADPTSPSNGSIEVKVWKEVYVPPKPRKIEFGCLRGCSGQSFASGSSAGDPWTSSNSTQYSADSIGAVQMSASNTLGFGPEERGATVEGGASSQTFQYTSWAGDEGDPLIFVFHLKPSTMQEKTPLYCAKCGSSLPESAKYCPGCGRQL